jgi:hypothetical protein
VKFILDEFVSSIFECERDYYLNHKILVIFVLRDAKPDVVFGQEVKYASFEFRFQMDHYWNNLFWMTNHQYGVT